MIPPITVEKTIWPNYVKWSKMVDLTASEDGKTGAPEKSYYVEKWYTRWTQDLKKLRKI